MRAVILAVLAGALLVGCGEDSSPPVVEEDRPGSPAVYARIESLTDCSLLQEEFDIADENADRLLDSGQVATIPLAYMDAADERMQALGCYG